MKSLAESINNSINEKREPYVLQPIDYERIKIENILRPYLSYGDKYKITDKNYDKYNINGIIKELKDEYGDKNVIECEPIQIGRGGRYRAGAARGGRNIPFYHNGLQISFDKINPDIKEKIVINYTLCDDGAKWEAEHGGDPEKIKMHKNLGSFLEKYYLKYVE